MHGAVTGDTGRGIGIACSGRLSVDALPEFLYFVCVALRAFCRSDLGGDGDFMNIAVARLAGGFPKRTVNADGDVRCLIGVAA